MTWFERLSALDATFLDIEDDAAHMHVGAVVTFEAERLTLEHGGIDIDRLRPYIEGIIASVPRYRQRLAWSPVPRHPVWVDDDRFNIHYHVRHTALPRPGDERQLKRLAGRIFSQHLDRRRPLWELWVVEGLTDGRLAIISKAHHCMVDGVAGVGLMAALLRTSPDDRQPEVKPFEPRPAPSPGELAGAEIRHRAQGAGGFLEKLRSALIDGGSDLMEKASTLASGLMETVSEGVVPASPTPLWTDKLGPHRRFDVLRMELADVKAIKAALGGKVNDVVLAVVSGALRRFFARRGTDPASVMDCRAFVPVAVRKKGAKLGNRVSMMLAHLPVSEMNAQKRYDAVVAETTRLKGSKQVESGEVMAEVGDYTGAGVIARTMRLAVALRPYNLVVTNIPGPPFPLYLLGARLLEAYPLVPLYGHTSVGLALFSYAGGLFWGVTGDWQAAPDLHELVGDLEASYDELRALAASRSAA